MIQELGSFSGSAGDLALLSRVVLPLWLLRYRRYCSSYRRYCRYYYCC